MTTDVHHDLDALIQRASRQVGLLWPLGGAIAVNPLLDAIDESFASAVSALGGRLGIDPWPADLHLDEAASRDLILPVPDTGSPGRPRRPATMFARSAAATSQTAENARAMVGQALLEACAGREGSSDQLLERLCESLDSQEGWVSGPPRVAAATIELLEAGSLESLLDRLVGWSDDDVVEEMARHLARLPGWAAWAKWNDEWSREPHPAALSRRDLLALSMAVDLAWLRETGCDRIAPPALLDVPSDVTGLARLELLERALHGEILGELGPRRPVVVEEPRFQVITCIDVRSEPLRRAIEAEARAETLGFAGFFGVFAQVAPAGDRETYESFPVRAGPSALIAGGPRPAPRDGERVAVGGTLAELTHEPSAMFALAEASGFLGSPWLLARSLLPGARLEHPRREGEWVLEAEGIVDIAEGALRGMGLTTGFADEVLILGHRSTTANNPHFAALECGACAGHGGGPNAAALASVLNAPSVRGALGDRGIIIPSSTQFLSGEHDTTRQVVEVHGEASVELLALLEAASDTVACEQAGGRHRKVAGARRELDRRARDLAEVRPEWGLADHVSFVIAPRSSIRGADLRGRSFLHSYDPESDEHGAILGSILAAPMVVGQWINASYYFSSVAPEVLGAGDKTLLNQVGDFAVIQGEDPDLRMGVPWQSVTGGRRPVHLPIRLLVAVEAPLDRIVEAVRSADMPRRLVEGGWVRLVGRTGPQAPWHSWDPELGWTAP